MKDEKVAIFVSILLGLGLASFFRRACKNGKCIIIKGPPLEDIKKHVYKIEDECYEYSPVATTC
jgi:hypothetical protein